jgi:hypothetical protein
MKTIDLADLLSLIGFVAISKSSLTTKDQREAERLINRVMEQHNITHDDLEKAGF